MLGFGTRRPGRFRRPQTRLIASLAAGAALLAAGDAFCAPARPASGAPAPHPERKAPETRVAGYRLVVERIQQQQNVGLDFTENPAGKRSGRQSVSVALAVYPPAAADVANIDGLDQRLVAYAGAGTGPLLLQSYPSDDSNPLATGIWRTNILAQEVDLPVSRLSRLQGELIVYPSAKRTTIDLPLAGKLPVSREVNGVRCTVKQTRFRSDIFGVVVENEWAPGLSLSRTNSEAQDGFTALTRAGTVLYPRREAMSPVRREGRQAREYTFAFSEVKEAPATLRLELMVRSGAPKHLAFTLPDLPLPDSLGLEPEIEKGDAADSGPLSDDNPLYQAGGGTLAFTVRGNRDPNARLLLGLSRKQGSGYGGWRWLEAPVDRTGRGAIPNVRTGHYRVALRWAAGEAPAPAAEIKGMVEIDVLAGKAVSLPAFDAGAQR